MKRKQKRGRNKTEMGIGWPDVANKNTVCSVGFEFHILKNFLSVNTSHAILEPYLHKILAVTSLKSSVAEHSVFYLTTLEGREERHLRGNSEFRTTS